VGKDRVTAYSRLLEPIWYAAYGSNLSSERFNYYIRGGALPGTTRTYEGCRLNAAPQDQRPGELQGQLYFARRSRFWGGGIAFVSTSGTQAVPVRARLYRITLGQLEDVLAQENGLSVGTVGIDWPFPAAGSHLDLLSDDHVYGRVDFCGEVDDRPIATFASTINMDATEFVTPSTAYIQVISRGLRETWALTPREVADYLSQAPGVVGNYNLDQLAEIARASA